jgi:hypothetical protein
VGLSLGESCGKTKVDDLDLPVGSNNDIISFDISMRYSPLMQVTDSLSYSHRYILLLLYLQSISLAANVLVKGLGSFDVLEQQVNLSLVLKTVSQLDDVGVVEFA